MFSTPVAERAEVVQFRCLNDNYACLIHDPVSLQTAVIDTPDAEEITRQLQRRDWQLTHIFTTHHHWDHTDGHSLLKQRYDCEVIGAADSEVQKPLLDLEVRDGDHFFLGHFRVEVLATPGHTLDHLCYWLPEVGAVFVGDTLFSMGCGRLFEGTATQMWQSIQKIRALPDSTLIYCGHEYTAANARFAVKLEPDNVDLQQRIAVVQALRQQALPTLPTSVRQERLTNPFMRADIAELKQQLAMSGESAENVFAHIRKLKDRA